MEGEESKIAAGVLWALKGDAAQRAIMAWHFGWPSAQKAAGRDWMIPLLSDLLVDSYSAVRYMAFESLKTYDGFHDLDYDFDGTAASREAAQKETLRRWTARSHLANREAETNVGQSQLLLEGLGIRNAELVKKFLTEQDSTPISIVE